MEGSMRVVGDKLLQYLRQQSLREPEILQKLRAKTEALPEAGWEAAPEQSQLLSFLARLMGAERILEVGTFTGYTTLWLALSLPDGGRIVTLDMMEEYTNVGETFWSEAGVRDKIDLQIGPAIDALHRLIEDGESENFDMVFIDANKKDYDRYYESALQLVRPGGLIAFDNMFWDGRVLDDNDQEKSTRALRALSEKLKNDPRIDFTMIPIDDGLGLAQKLAGDSI